MINKIFFDLDSTLIYTDFSAPDQEHKQFEVLGHPHYTIFRPCAKNLIDFARSVAGEENVYILTSSETEYAHKINELGLFGFDSSQIFAREDIKRLTISTAYGGIATYPLKIADKNNILIDDLPPKYNWNKIQMIGLDSSWEERYLQVREYYGINFPDDPFEENVKNFITKINKK